MEIPWSEIKDTRIGIIKKRAEIESIEDRIIQLEKEVSNHHDLHKARMKLKHTKEMLVDLETERCEQDVLLLKMNITHGLPDV